MEQDALSTLLLPLSLGVIMLGLGLSLTLDDFRRVLVYPRAVVVALLLQTLFLPLVCFFIAAGFGLKPAYAVGLMLLAAAPGGIVANLYSHLANGDVALNITLTATNSLLSLFTLPLVVNLALEYFMGVGQYVPLQYSKVVQLFVIVLGPVGIGMILRAKAPEFAARVTKPFKIFSILLLAVLIAAVTVKSKGELLNYFPQVGLAALCFNVVSLAVGYMVPQWIAVSRRQSIAIGMEIGIHNSTLAMAIALSPLMLNNPEMAIPPAVYSVSMFLTAGAFAWWLNRKPA